MPTSFGGLLLFVVLLAPGFAFVVRRETRFVPRNASVFRETASVVLASVLANTAALAIFALARAFYPRATPDLDALVDGPGAYFKADYAAVTLWGLGLLGLATGLAAFFAVPPGWFVKLWKHLPKWLQPAWLEELGNPIVYKSAWDQLIHIRLDDGYTGPITVWVSCDLDDGSWVSGKLYSLNPDINETGDRELILVAPIQRLAPTGTAVEDLEVGAMSISSRNTKYVAWSYVQSDIQADVAAS